MAIFFVFVTGSYNFKYMQILVDKSLKMFLYFAGVDVCNISNELFCLDRKAMSKSAKMRYI